MYADTAVVSKGVSVGTRESVHFFASRYFPAPSKVIFFFLMIMIKARTVVERGEERPLYDLGFELYYWEGAGGYRAKIIKGVQYLVQGKNKIKCYS